MPLDDNDLLDFPASTIAGYDAGDGRRYLREHGDVYRAQLVAARWLDGYRRRRLSDKSQPWGRSEDYERGWDEAMRDVVAHLRQGDFLPAGILYRDEIEGRTSHPDLPDDHTPSPD